MQKIIKTSSSKLQPLKKKLSYLINYRIIIRWFPPRGVELALGRSPLEGAVCELESIKLTEGKTV
jgi:hypothetical protein